MAERIVEVGVPPAARQEITGYSASCDPVAERIILSESGKVADLLVTEGYLKSGDGVQMRFVPDPNINLESPTRSVTITGAVRDADGRFFKMGGPICVLKIETPVNNRN
jgi:hypothetical protein